MNFFRNLYIRCKDKILSHSLLCRKREMFWLKQSPYNKNIWEVKVPVGNFSNMTHRELFAHLNLLGINVSLENTIRGYYNPKNGVLMIYSGVKHTFPNPSICNSSAILTTYNYFKKKGVSLVGLGSIHNRFYTLIGKDWLPQVTLDIDALDKGKCIYIHKVKLKSN